MKNWILRPGILSVPQRLASLLNAPAEPPRRPLEPNCIDLWTDESRMIIDGVRKVGYAVYRSDDSPYNHMARSPPSHNIYEAKLSGPIWVLETCDVRQSLHFRINCELAVKTLQKFSNLIKPPTSLNREKDRILSHRIFIQRRLRRLAGATTTFEWVKGHSTDLGNQRADALAKAALDLPDVIETIPSYITAVRRSDNTIIHSTFTKTLLDIGHAKRLKKYKARHQTSLRWMDDLAEISLTDSTRIFMLLSMSATDWTDLCHAKRIILDAITTNVAINKRWPNQTTACIACGVDKTREHVLMDCPLYNAIRATTRQKVVDEFHKHQMVTHHIPNWFSRNGKVWWDYNPYNGARGLIPVYLIQFMKINSCLTSETIPSFLETVNEHILNGNIEIIRT